MQVTRRGLMATLPSLTMLSSCALTPAASPAGLEPLINAPAGQRASAAGYVVFKGETLIAAETVGMAQLGPADAARPFTPQNRFRAASISKLVTALTALALHRDGSIDLDTPITQYWRDYPLSVPSGAPTAPSLRQLLAHLSGLSDADRYWIAHPGDITSALVHDIRPQMGPVGVFEYCNLGYGLIATVLEKVSGQRFDDLARTHVLQLLEIEAGFNWSGVSAEKRRQGATLYREGTTGWIAQIDGPQMLASDQPSILLETGATLASYQPGQNGTLFSPQGGLRANLVDLAKLAHALKTATELTEPVWRLNADRNNGQHDQGYFTSFGSGVHVYEAADSFWPGQRLWGHHGEAYGLYAGAWHAPDLDISFSYVVTGTPETPPRRSPQHPALNTFTAHLITALRAAYARNPAAK